MHLWIEGWMERGMDRQIDVSRHTILDERIEEGNNG